MMKKLAFVLFLFILPLNICFSQDDSLSRDSIELVYQQCKDSAFGTYEYMLCIDDAATLWDEELNRVYQLILAQLPANQKELFRQSQRQWVAFRDAEIVFCEEFYDREGKGWQLDQAGRRLDLTKQRTLELWRYYHALEFE
jgi:uncharacterized protein YecT (DUF1311 family)